MSNPNKTTDLPICLNIGAPAQTSASFQLPADGWYQLAREGEFPVCVHGTDTRIVQVIDAPAITALVAAFRAEAALPAFAGQLVDREHFSGDPSKESRAAAWLEAVEARPGGLWGKLRLTNSGRSDLQSGDYRYISPVFALPPREYLPGDRVRPVAILGAGLTNKPNLRGMVPLSNRQGDPLANPSTPQGYTPMDYKAMLLQLLGLPATATDAEIQAAMASGEETMNRGRDYPTLEAQNKALLASQVEADLVKYADRITDVDQMRVALTQNRDLALQILEQTKLGPNAPARVHNRSTATVPAMAAGQAKAPASELPQHICQEKAVRAYQTANRCDYATAFNRVREEKPELFLVAADEAL